tara:strand:- start:143 stop:448 length:306 start_codon:yes stop_codon:yes gene_type:complete
MDRTNTIIIAVAIVIGALLHGGIYEIRANVRATSNVINKFTGSTWFCPVSDSCRKLEETPTNEAAQTSYTQPGTQGTLAEMMEEWQRIRDEYNALRNGPQE